MIYESAFPIPESSVFVPELGMTLRDYFAAKALVGLLAADANLSIPAEKIAEWAYAQAGAMLKERAKE
jgi:predicted ATP-grasp superfamily ATP-dependent carboligase